MILNNNFIKYSENISSYSLCSYRNIVTKFVNIFISIYEKEFGEEVYNKSIIYGKYYLFYKTQGCIYNEKVMKIINQVEFIINKKIY